MVISSVAPCIRARINLTELVKLPLHPTEGFVHSNRGERPHNKENSTGTVNASMYNSNSPMLPPAPPPPRSQAGGGDRQWMWLRAGVMFGQERVKQRGARLALSDGGDEMEAVSLTHCIQPISHGLSPGGGAWKPHTPHIYKNTFPTVCT